MTIARDKDWSSHVEEEILPQRGALRAHGAKAVSTAMMATPKVAMPTAIIPQPRLSSIA